MNRILKMSALLLLLAASVSGCSKRGGGDTKMKAYPDDVAGLEAFMADFAAAANGGNAKRAQLLGDSLVIADAEEFFATYYPADMAERLTAEYRAHPPGAAPLIALLRDQKAHGRSDVLVEKFAQVADENATGYQEYALKEQTKPLALYSYRARPPGKLTGQHLYNFVYLGGAWKLAGPMKAIKPELASDPKMDALAGLRGKDRQTFFNTGALPE